MELENKKPESFYKYRSINNSVELEKDNSINALINHKMAFSSRVAFNDPFDSKIMLITPTPKQVEEFASGLSGSLAREFSQYVSGGEFTEYGYGKIQTFKRQMDELLNSYAFCCLSPKPDSNLMWSHYAQSHSGFCIEFDASKIDAEKVNYSQQIASIDILDFMDMNSVSGESLAFKIRSALFCKLTEWEYESEYRMFAADSLAKLEIGEKFKLVSYPEDFVKSVIFGFRMEAKVKAFIMERMPAHVKFKQAYPGESTIVIRDY